MKRWISMLLSAAIVLSLLAGAATAAFAAENTVIDGVDVLVENFTLGKSTTDVSIVLPSDADYAVKSYSVVDLDDNPVTGTLEAGLYGIYIFLEPKAGYVFAEDGLGWNVNGDGMTMASNWETTANSVTLYARFNLYDPATTINYIEVIVTGVEKGKNSADVKVTVPEGANYTAELNGIYDDYNLGTEFSGVFGIDLYRVDIAVSPKPGYTLLADSADCVVDAAGVTDVDAFSRSTTHYGLATAFDFRTPIDKVEVTVTGAEEGKKATDVKVTVPEGVNYAVDDVYVKDINWNDFTGTFGKDIYTADIYLMPAEGYCFSEDAKVTVNGGEPDYLYTEASSINIEYDLNLRTPIDKVEITATELKQGLNVADVKVTVPENANYILESAVVRDENGNVVTGKLDGYNYYYDIYVKAKDGYYLDEDKVTVRINGGEPDYINNENSMSFLNIEKNYFLGKYINKIELPAWPAAIKAGDPIPRPDPHTPDGKNYTILAVWSNEDGSITSSGTSFENNKAYTYQYTLLAESGSAFADDVTIVVGGVTHTGLVMNMGSILVIGKTYPIGDVKLVDKIVLSSTAPTADKEPGEITSSGTGYKLKDAYWGVANNANAQNISNPGKTFRIGEHVYIGIEIELEEGYSFDVNTKVWYNGKAYNMILEYTSIGSNDSVVRTAIYLGQLKAASNPNTGDRTPVLALTMLTIASILGMGIVLGRRKAF